MPKPTLIQSVLRKPTRSYADPHAPSPWADSPSPQPYYDAPASRYSAQRDGGVFLGYREEPRYPVHHAGPSRIRAPPSVNSDSQVSRRSRFPAPRKAQSTIVIAEQPRIGDERDYAPGGRNGAGTVKKKKKKPKSQADTLSVDSGSVNDAIPPSVPRAARPKKTTIRRQNVPSPEQSPMDFAPPPPLVTESDRGSSTESSATGPVSPPTLAVNLERRPMETRHRPGISAIQKAIAAGIVPPLSPPSSDWSSEQSRDRLFTPTPEPSTDSLKNSRDPVQQPQHPLSEGVSAAAPIPVAQSTPPIPPKSADRLSVQSISSESSQNDIFYTPRSSMDLSQTQEDLPTTTAAIPAISEPAPETPIESSRVIPALQFQPPTPASVADPEASPFHPQTHSQPTLHPNVASTPPSAARPEIFVKSPTPSPALQSGQQNVDHDLDTQSATGEVGSDDDDESERRAAMAMHSRSSSFTRPFPSSQGGSRPPSVVYSGFGQGKTVSRSPSAVMSLGDDRRPSSRASSRMRYPKNSFEDFVVRRNSMPLSELSFGREGSIRSGISGYGKGGWAAAHATRSGSATPVAMYMPSSGNDGWAEFQQPIAPPRQSRFTPLPLASQPKTFNAIVHGRTPNGSAPSSYSQSSDDELEDDMPKPSRSYRNQARAGGGSSEGRPKGLGSVEGSAPGSVAGLDDRFDETLRERQMTLGPMVDPYAIPRPAAPSSVTSSIPPPVPKDAAGSRRSWAPSRASMTPSASFGGYESRPISPTPSRPSSRVGFEPPSFLNPDTLTVLPEMTPEDSARTYVPSEPAKSHRRAASVFGGRSRGARSEIGGYDDQGDDIGDVPRRSKSAVGHRDDLSRWEGTSVGEGVLLESHCRAGNVTGYR
jgi:hypothetical protein